MLSRTPPTLLEYMNDPLSPMDVDDPLYLLYG